MEAAQAFFDGRYETAVDEDDEMEDLSMTRSAKRASGLEVSYSIQCLAARQPIQVVLDTS